jgi:hypothetical protein
MGDQAVGGQVKRGKDKISEGWKAVMTLLLEAGEKLLVLCNDKIPVAL